MLVRRWSYEILFRASLPFRLLKNLLFLLNEVWHSTGCWLLLCLHRRDRLTELVLRFRLLRTTIHRTYPKLVLLDFSWLRLVLIVIGATGLRWIARFMLIPCLAVTVLRGLQNLNSFLIFLHVFEVHFFLFQVSKLVNLIFLRSCMCLAEVLVSWPYCGVAVSEIGWTWAAWSSWNGLICWFARHRVVTRARLAVKNLRGLIDCLSAPYA